MQRKLSLIVKPRPEQDKYKDKAYKREQDTLVAPHANELRGSFELSHVVDPGIFQSIYFYNPIWS